MALGRLQVDTYSTPNRSRIGNTSTADSPRIGASESPPDRLEFDPKSSRSGPESNPELTDLGQVLTDVGQHSF